MKRHRLLVSSLLVRGPDAVYGARSPADAVGYEATIWFEPLDRCEHGRTGEADRWCPPPSGPKVPFTRGFISPAACRISTARVDFRMRARETGQRERTGQHRP